MPYSEIDIMCRHIFKAGVCHRSDGKPLELDDLWNNRPDNAFAPYMDLLEWYEIASTRLGVFHDGSPYRKYIDDRGLFWGCAREGDPEPDYAAEWKQLNERAVVCMQNVPKLSFGEQPANSR